MNILNAIIIDDEIESSTLLNNLLSCFKNINIVSIEKDPSLALTKTLCFKPDLLFLDIEMPVINGFEFIQKLKENGFSPRIVLVSGQIQYGIKAIKEGVFDYLLKPFDLQEIKDCIYRLNTESLNRSDILSEKEKEVMNCLCKGWPVKQIGNNLNLSPHTISYHKNQILKKIGAKSTAELLSKTIL